MDYKKEYIFKPFERVLVRNNAGIWTADLYSYKGVDCHVCVGCISEECIPYEGNEHMLGTINNPNNPEI